MFLMLFWLFFERADAANKIVSGISGVYKVRLQAQDWKKRGRSDADIENILEIVPFKEDKIYFRLKAENPVNGKICGLWGIATQRGQEFTYLHNDGSSQNELTIAQKSNQLERAVYRTGTKLCRF